MNVNRPTVIVWSTALLIAGFAGNLFFACGANLVAFAVVAVITLGLRAGSLVALGIWLESQVLGFALFGYPHEPMTVAWGIMLGAATIVAAVVSSALTARGTAIAFAGAFAGYELALAAFALAARSGFSGFTPAIIGELLVSNAAFTLGGLAAFRLLHIATPRIVSAVARRRHA